MTNTLQDRLPGWKLALCISLPLALVWGIPMGHGPSNEAFPTLLGLLAAGMIGTVGLGEVRRTALAWVVLVMGALLLRASPIALYNLMLLPIGLALWVGLALGSRAWSEGRVARAVGLGLGLGMLINLLAAVVQYFDLETHFQPWVSNNVTDRPYGNLRQPNYMAVLLVLGLSGIWWGRARNAFSLRAAILLAAGICLGVALSGSRFGLLGLLVVAVMAWIWRRSLPKRDLWIYAVAPLVTCLLSWVSSALARGMSLGVASVVDREATSISRRFLHWESTLEMIASAPWLGVGWRNYRHARFLSHPADVAVEMVEHTHNLFLQLAVELGIPLMLAIAGSALYFAIRTKPWQEQEPRRQSAWMALVVLFLYSMVEPGVWVLSFLFLAAVAAGVVLAPQSAGRIHTWGLPRMLAGVLLLISGLALVDYDRASAPFRGGSMLNWGNSFESRLESARSAVLFGTYADWSVLANVSVTPENAPLVRSLADRMMHFGPEPEILNARLRAACLQGDTETAVATAAAYSVSFPAGFERLLRSIAPDVARSCKLTPWLPGEEADPPEISGATQ